MRQSLLPLLLSAAYLVTPIHAGHGLDRGHHHLELLHKRHVVTPSTTEAHDKRSVLDGILCVFGSGHSCEKQQAAEAVKSAQAAFSAASAKATLNGGTELNVLNSNATSIVGNLESCGPAQTRCPEQWPNGIGSLCYQESYCRPATCFVGFAFDLARRACVDVTLDRLNCGQIGNVCPDSSVCLAGVCTSTSGPEEPGGSTTEPTVVPGSAASASARARSRHKRSAASSLCPNDETACPIVGSATFLKHKSSNFYAFRQPHLVDASSLGGFECLDTTFSLESCGGCTSMGEGENCLSIRHAANVGCSSGACHVFSCEPGYVPSSDATRCVRARRHPQHPQHHHHDDDDQDSQASSNSKSPSSAGASVKRRHGHSGSGGGGAKVKLRRHALVPH